MIVAKTSRSSLVLVLVARAAAADPAPAPAQPADDELTTDAFQPTPAFDLHWRILYLPGRALELTLLPLRLLLEANEEYRLDRRLNDVLEFDHDRYKISPRFKFSFSDGPAIGARFTRSKLFQHRATLSVAALRRYNGDSQELVEYTHKLLLPGGRGLRTYAFTEIDKNQHYYGLGNATVDDDARTMKSDDQGVVAETDIQGIDRYTYSGIVGVALRRQKLSPGAQSGFMPLGIDGDTTAPPIGFGAVAVYADLHLVGRFDTRDTAARPTRGWLLELDGLGRKEVTGEDLSAVTVTGTARVYVPVIAEGRALSFAIGGIATAPLFPGDTIPLDSEAILGRALLRGFDRERFRDRYAAFGSAEYRFPIYEYLASKAGLDAFVFFDAGVVWGERAFKLDPVHYDYGLGMRAAHETTLVFQTILGYGPEGFELTIGTEKTL